MGSAMRGRVTGCHPGKRLYRHFNHCRFALYEPVEFVHHFLANKLEFSKVRESIAIHVPCSSKKMGIADSFMALASKCAHEVTNTDIPCCGMAGTWCFVHTQQHNTRAA